MGYDTQGMFVMAFNSYDTNSVCTVIATNVILDYLYLFYAVYLRTIFLVKLIPQRNWFIFANLSSFHVCGEG